MLRNIFQLHGIDEHRRVVLKKCVNRTNILPFLAQMPPFTIGFEACGSSHYWHRKFSELGHSIKILPARHVKAFVLNQKNNSRDAAAIVGALNRPEIHPVEPKTID